MQNTKVYCDNCKNTNLDEIKVVPYNMGFGYQTVCLNCGEAMSEKSYIAFRKQQLENNK